MRSKFQTRSVDGRKAFGRRSLLAVAIASAFSMQVTAQEIEEVVVTGVRAVIQSSIDLKRSSTEIVDGLSAAEIGELPALSIGEALENITGASSHRENGGASEISIRGLGPFLSTTVVNGREATNGAGNRAVNFSIFPSELFNKIAIHKTQSAEYIEGAVAGQIHLDTLRPLDYGKQRLQIGLKGSYNQDEQEIDGGQSIGSRATVSYVDQFEFGAGELGISIGGQLRDDTAPEQEYTTGTGGGRLEACRLESFDANAQPVFFNENPDDLGRCDDELGSGVSNDEIQAIIDSDPSINSVDDIPFAYLARDHRFRRNTTTNEIASLFGAVQWQTDDWNINVEGQFSERNRTELRQDLQFQNTQEGIRNLVSNPETGLVDRLTALRAEVRSNTTDWKQDEEYTGIGINIEHQATDNLMVSLDVSYSDTERVETDIEINLGANQDSSSVINADDFSVTLDHNAVGTDGIALATINGIFDGGVISPTTLDITDPTLFNRRDRAQLRARQQIRENTIGAIRADFVLNTEDTGFIHTVKGGLRLSTLTYDTFGGDRNNVGVSEFDDEDFDLDDDDNNPNDETNRIVAEAAANCGQTSFPEGDFLSSASGGQDLVTSANGLGSGSTFATFDFDCLGNTLLQNRGGLDGLVLQNGRTTNSVDLEERTTAVYLQAEFESEIAGLPARGNFGVRIVNTQIESVGYRRGFSVEEDDQGIFSVSNTGDNFTIEDTITANNSYTEVLPSATLIVDLNEDVVLRAGAFRGISRPDPNSYGNGRNLVSSNDPTATSVEDALSQITANGNPFLEPLPSLNVDLGVEWYPNDDTILSIGGYWKQFEAGFENTTQIENIEVNGVLTPITVNTTQVSDDSSTLKGVEITASHAFHYLPGFLGGFGGKVSYNYASSDFEFEDGNGGDGIGFDGLPEIGILEPAGLFGLSRHVASTQLYWQNDDFNVSVIHKLRSQYFQGFGRDTSARVRYVEDSSTVDLRLSYKLTDNIKLSFEGLNLLDEPRVDYRGVDGNVSQVLSYGPRFFAGLTAKF